MVTEEEVEVLTAILTEARWLQTSGESDGRVDRWTQESLRQRLPRLPLTTGRALARGHRLC